MTYGRENGSNTSHHRGGGGGPREDFPFGIGDPDNINAGVFALPIRPALNNGPDDRLALCGKVVAGVFLSSEDRMPQRRWPTYNRYLAATRYFFFSPTHADQ